MKSIIILFGISGCGKTTLADYLVHHDNYAKIKTSTTRPKRTPNEKDYHFMSIKQFQEHHMFASTYFDKHYYGTNLSDIYTLLQHHHHLVVVLTWSGVVNYVKEFKDSNIKIYPMELFCPLKTALDHLRGRRDNHTSHKDTVCRIQSYKRQAKRSLNSPINEYIINSYASINKSSNLRNEAQQIKSIIGD